MGIKARLLKLEQRQPTKPLNIIINKPFSSKPLPEPVITGGVKVSFRYAEKPDKKADVIM
jgi:hypothetical protein